MITQAKVVSRRVPFIVGYGGGVNSAAVIVGLHQRGIRPDLITFADTGGEKPETYQHLLVMEAFLARIEFPPLTKVVKDSPRVGDRTLEEECLRRETMPSRAFGLSSCAQRWKIEPQEKHLNHWPPAQEAWARGDKPIKALGFDGGEERRAKFFEDAKLLYWYPLIEWGWEREDCVAAIEGAGLPVPPKSACFYCPSSTKSEVVELSRRHPRLFERSVAIERRALESTKHELRTIAGLGRHWSWEELVAASPEEFARAPEAPVESCTICADGEAA